MRKQVIEIYNQDDTTHNAHFMADRQADRNVALTSRGKVSLRFEESETPIKLRCDIHPWEQAWLAVLPNPFFHVTTADGTYELPPMPPGEYAVVAWHEVYGEQERRVVLRNGGTEIVDFIFQGK